MNSKIIPYKDNFSVENATHLLKKLINGFRKDGDIHFFGGQMDGCSVILVAGPDKITKNILSYVADIKGLSPEDYKVI